MASGDRLSLDSREDAVQNATMLFGNGSPPRRGRSSLVVLTVTAGLWPGALAAQVSGQIAVLEARGRAASDVATAVVYLEGRAPRAAALPHAQMATDGRQFRPRVLVVPAGSTVQFQNLDPFNHNVFSLSEPNAFDLGLYGRGEMRPRRFARAGLVRLYCNVHPRMSAFILVRDNPWYTQPGPDGQYAIPDVPPGHYVLHVWHERSTTESTREIDVPAGGLAGLADTLDASGYRWVQHPNKYGRDYESGGARERY
jgi:plastocyanin